MSFGYEIHMGRTMAMGAENNVATLADGRKDGYFLSDRTWGTYLHGILDNDEVIAKILQPYTSDLPENQASFQAFKEQQYDKLADLIRVNVNMELIYKTLQN